MSAWFITTLLAVRAAIPSSHGACLAFLELAREELLARGFAPTSDKDTARWLQVHEGEDGSLSLSLTMRTSADGAQTGFMLAIASAPKKTPTRWHYRRQTRCCDDHAEESDHLVELRWTRQDRSRLATISIVEFAEMSSDREARAERELFHSVARAAADRCLDE